MRCAMRCDEVQKALAGEPIDAALQPAIAAHLAGCPACDSVRLLYARIDEALTQQPVWQPPAGFAQRIAVNAPAPPPSRSPLVRGGVTDAAMLGLLVAAAGYAGAYLLPLLTPAFGSSLLEYASTGFDTYQHFVLLASQALVANAIPLGWGCALLSLTATAWFTRRALA